MKYLVTGGAGFIGSNLIEALLKEGGSVVSLDNYSTGLKENHIDSEKAVYLEGDTRDLDQLHRDFDYVYHLGEYSRVSTSFDEIEKVWNYNCAGTFKVLEFCRKKNIKLIYAASSTKYGDNGEGENQSPYAWFKSKNTELINNYFLWYNLPYAICYFYNVYGPKQIQEGPYSTVVGIFERQRAAGEPLTVVSPGTQRRSFTHVDDVVSGLLALRERGNGDGYSFGTTKTYSISELAEMFGGQSVFIPARRGDRKMSSIDLSKSKKDLAWSAKLNLEEYINKFLGKLEK